MKGSGPDSTSSTGSSLPGLPRAVAKGSRLEALPETHQLGPHTREWLVSTSACPGFGAPHRRIVGFSEARQGYVFVRHQPYFSTLLITASGEGRVWVDGSWHTCRAGQAYLMPAHSACAFHAQAGKVWNLHWVIHFDPAQVPGLPPGSPPRLIACEGSGLRHAIEGLHQEHCGLAEEGVLALWGSLIDRHVQRLLDPKRRDQRLARLWTLVHQDLGAAWSIGKLAREVHLSEEQLRRLCLLDYGQPPMAHLARLRMQVAASLLLDTQETLESIGARVGYADPFAFSTAFKRIMGLPPRSYRNHGGGALKSPAP